MEGFLLIDKPAGMTSHDVVDQVRRLTGERRVGHAGTLDPFATGLLIVGVGRAATREMQKLVGLDKEYEAVFVLGASSTTDDVEGEIISAPLTTPLTVAPGFPARQSPTGVGGSLGAIHVQPEPRLKPGATAVETVISQFIGEIEQVPPTYSAIKIGGKKMYEEARAGRPMEGKARRVRIHAMDIRPIGRIGPMGLMSMTRAKVRANIRCSSGTYIRALARDVGRALGGGGYVEELRRTAIGPYTIEEAHTLESLQTRTQELLTPVETLLSRL